MYLDINYNCNFDDDDGYLTIDGDILVNFNNDDENCGRIKISVYDKDWHDLLEAADFNCQEVYMLMKSFLIERKENKTNKRVAIIERIKIKEDRRNLGVGSEALKKTIVDLNKIWNVDYILLVVKDDTKNQLLNFYKKFGFKEFGDKLTGKMILNLQTKEKTLSNIL